MSSQHLLLLPEELLVEILSWVSVKALMRFRCVSKWWNSLVLDPTFVKLHLQRSSKDTHVLLTFEDDNDESKYCAPCSVHGLLENPSSTIDGCHQFNHDYSVLGVCNGLVCLRDSYLGDEFEKYWVRFWNPATRVISEDSPRIRLSSRDYEIGWALTVLHNSSSKVMFIASCYAHCPTEMQETWLRSDSPLLAKTCNGKQMTYLLASNLGVLLEISSGTRNIVAVADNLALK
ncbi:F-box protein [Spatholobus suberectus]|nr:F-box protein [Spatholobus suberectus]